MGKLVLSSSCGGRGRINLTNSEAEIIEGMPVDAIQFSHQSHCKLNQDANLGVLPFLILKEMEGDVLFY